MRKPRLLSELQSNRIAPAKLGYGRREYLARLISRDRARKSLSPEQEQLVKLTQALERREKELAKAHRQVHDLEHAHDDRNAEAEALRRVAEAVGALFDLEEMLMVVAGIAVQVTATDSSQVYLLNDAKEELVLRAVDDAEDAQEMIGKVRMKIGEGLAGWVAQHKEAAAITHNAYRDSRFKFIPELQEDRFQSMLSVPLTYRGDVIGVINVRTHKPHEYTQTQVRLLQSIASQIAGAVENSRQYRKMERRASQLSTLSELSKTITSDMYLEEILQLIVAATAKTMNFKLTTLMLVDEEKGELVIKATQTKSKDYTKKPNIKIGESIAGRAILERKTITVYDVRHAAEYKFPDIARREGLCAMAAVPLQVKNRVIGVLNCYTDKPHKFTDEEIQFLTALGNHAAIAIDHAKLMVRSAIIQEMHHRVKNNLQQVASLLRLQMHYVGQRSVEQVLSESLNRILAIASVHELLSREDLDIISARQIAESIMTATKQSLIAPNKHIVFNVDGPDVLLPSSKATGLALILNEFVQNSVEHGFGDGYDEGSITIVLHEDAHEVQLLVTNSGNLLPPDFDRSTKESLGLQIVESLARGDLNGQFTLERVEDLTCAKLVFPK
jgi:two-component sensor histidine kinase/putative methionine-R-sulfoxide reductase with GAF domain